jgi:uncharacterized protein with PIN domain
MRIIKQGKLPEEKEYECTCRYCKTEFAFRQGEAETVYDQRDGNSLKILCPTCKRECWIGL